MSFNSKVLLEENTKFSVFKGKFDNNGFINDFKAKYCGYRKGSENISICLIF